MIGDVKFRMPQPFIFDGAGFDPDLDGERLARQLRAIRDYLFGLEGDRFATVGEIASALGFPECSVSAQLRNLRKPRHGGYKIESRRLTETGLFGYRLARFGDGGRERCWHCGGHRLCNCIVCGIAEGLGTRDGPCQVCVVTPRAAAS